MSRELNPELFPDLARPDRPPLGAPPSAIDGMGEQDWRLLTGQFEILKRRFKEYESRLEATNSRLSDFMSAVKGRYDRLVGAVERLEEMTRSGLKDLTDRQAQMMSRLNERKVGDARIQELVDRHNQLVQGFELRLSQVQKVVAEQEMQLLASRSELKEAQREFARLKRI